MTLQDAVLKVLDLTEEKGPSRITDDVRAVVHEAGKPFARVHLYLITPILKSFLEEKWAVQKSAQSPIGGTIYFYCLTQEGLRQRESR